MNIILEVRFIYNVTYILYLEIHVSNMTSLNSEDGPTLYSNFVVPQRYMYVHLFNIYTCIMFEALNVMLEMFCSMLVYFNLLCFYISTLYRYSNKQTNSSSVSVVGHIPRRNIYETKYVNI